MLRIHYDRNSLLAHMKPQWAEQQLQILPRLRPICCRPFVGLSLSLSG